MKILLVEDHPLIRTALHSLVKRIHPDVQLLEADRLAVVPGLLEVEAPPDLVILDLTLPDGRGLNSLREIRKWLPETAIVVLSASPESDYGAIVIELGAAVYLEKSAGLSQISDALRPFFPAAEQVPVVETKLSKRQMQLLALMNDGLSNRDISQTLGLSEHTVKVHAWRLFKRLKVSSRTQATHLARRLGWVESASEGQPSLCRLALNQAQHEPSIEETR